MGVKEMSILSFIVGLFKPVAGMYEARQKRKAEKVEAKHNLSMAKLNAEARRYELQQAATTNWDIEAMRQSQFSWKDEYLLVILTLPFIGAFIPVVQDYVAQGFLYIDDMPIWYQTAFIGIIAASFGLRWLFQGKVNKMVGD